MSGMAQSVFGWWWWAGRRVVGEHWLLYSQNVILFPRSCSIHHALSRNTLEPQEWDGYPGHSFCSSFQHGRAPLHMLAHQHCI